MAAGLGRRSPREPGRLPSARPGSRDPSRGGHVCYSLAWRSPSHPVARLEPGPPRQERVGRFELPRLPRPAPGHPGSCRACGKDASHRLLQPTHITSTCTLPDSLVQCADQGRAPLDGGPPASAPPRPAIDAARTEVLTPPPLQVIAILADPRSRDPSRHATRPQPCRPRVELPARPLTSSVATAPFAPGLSVEHGGATTRNRLCRHPVKGGDIRGTRTPSIAECSLLCGDGIR